MDVKRVYDIEHLSHCLSIAVNARTTPPWSRYTRLDRLNTSARARLRCRFYNTYNARLKVLLYTTLTCAAVEVQLYHGVGVNRVRPAQCSKCMRRYLEPLECVPGHACISNRPLQPDKEGDIPEEREVLVRTAVVGIGGLLGSLVELVCREVRRVRDRAQIRHEGGVDVANSVPVDTVEKRVAFDLVNAQPPVRRCDQSAYGISGCVKSKRT